MRRIKGMTSARAALSLFLLALMPLTDALAASKERVIHSFHWNDGSQPLAGVIFDKNGTLYGTTSFGGGPHGVGTVFELTPAAHGQWTRKVLHYFGDYYHRAGGYEPYAPLILDDKGNLYGTTSLGGTYGYGTAFELMPDGKGGWSEKVLHNFNGSDGGLPDAGLVFDTTGNLYGTTTGAFSVGVAFELMPDGHGHWTEKILHIFGQGNDGFDSESSLILDRKGNLYGTTVFGGTGVCDGYGCGTVFELIHGANGQWTERVLHNFNGKDGYRAYGRLVFDKAGNLYGTTLLGGQNGGVAFELTPRAGGKWREKTLRSSDGRELGVASDSGLIFDAKVNLYGTGYGLGRGNYGNVFELIPGAEGSWSAKVLHHFQNNHKDGNGPTGDLVFDKAGNLYGTTQQGGTDKNLGDGTVFEVTP